MNVIRELDLSDQGTANLGFLCLDIAKMSLGDPERCKEYLKTVEQCIAYLDYDGDFVVRP